MASSGVSWAVGLSAAGAVIAVSGVVVHDRVFPAVEVGIETPRSASLASSPADAGAVVAELPPAVDDAIDWAEAASDRLLAGDPEAAMDALNQALRVDPDDISVHWKIARLDEGSAGERSLEAIVRLSMLDQEAPLELARRKLRRGDHAGALEAAKEATHRNEWSWEAPHLQGRAYLAAGQRKKAIAAFRRATTRPKAPSFPFNNLGYLLLLTGRNDEALDVLEVAVERGPVTHYMLNNLGLAYERAARLDEAELAFVGALELRDDDVKARLNLDRVAALKDAIIAERDARGIAELYPAFDDEDVDEALQLVPGG